MTTYILESAVCLACLYGFYYAFLRRETFFQWNRVFLLLAPLLSLLFPALNIPLICPTADSTESVLVASPIADLPNLVEQAQVAPQRVEYRLNLPLQEGWSLSLGEAIWYLYLVGMSVLMIRLIVRLAALYRLIKRCKTTHQEPAYTVLSGENAPTASFFGYVFWNKSAQCDEEEKLLLEHELVHVRQWHSIDVVVMEMMVLIQWFNPLMHAFRSSLCAMHEYIADEYVVRQTQERHAYATLLVQHQIAAPRARPALVNTFHSLIKHRLMMLAKHPSHPLRRVKYLLALPVFAALILLFSFRLVESLPVVAPLREAVQQVAQYSATLAEMTVISEKNQATEPTPYIFYWGSLQCAITHDPASDRYYGEIDTSPEELMENLMSREPRLFNGHSLEQNIDFRILNMHFKSNYNDEAVFASFRKEAESIFLTFTPNDEVTIHDLTLPNGKTAILVLSLEQDAPKWLSRKSAGEINWQQNPDILRPDPDMPTITWGNYDANRQFYTADEFWKILYSELSIEMPSSGYLEIDPATNEIIAKLKDSEIKIGGLSMRIIKGEGSVSIAPAINQIYTISELRTYLETRRVDIKSGTWISLYWDESLKLDKTTSTQPLPTLLSPTIASFTLVPDGDPRLGLRRNDMSTYLWEWGQVRTRFLDQYGTVFPEGDQLVTADRKINYAMNSLRAREISGLFSLIPRLYKEKKPEDPVLLSGLRFEIKYKGDSVQVTDGVVPAAFLKTIQSQLEAGDQLFLSDFKTADGTQLPLASIELSVRSDDPKPSISDKYFFQWGDFNIGMRRKTPEVEGDTIFMGLDNIQTLSKMIEAKPRLLFEDRPVTKTQFKIKCGNHTFKVGNAGLDYKQLKKLTDALAQGGSWWVYDFKADGVPLNHSTLVFSAADAKAIKTRQNQSGMASNLSLQVTPNPVTDKAVFTFSIPTKSSVYFMISDASGSITFSRKSVFESGTHSIQVTTQEMKRKGVLFATIETATDKATVRFLVEH